MFERFADMSSFLSEFLRVILADLESGCQEYLSQGIEGAFHGSEVGFAVAVLYSLRD